MHENVMDEPLNDAERDLLAGRRSQSLRARETLEAMQHDGVVRLVEAEDASGKRGVRVPVADPHRERHETLKAVRQRRRRQRSTGDE